MFFFFSNREGWLRKVHNISDIFDISDRCDRLSFWDDINDIFTNRERLRKCDYIYLIYLIETI